MLRLVKIKQIRENEIYMKMKYIPQNKQYITVDNRYALLYTVCCKEI